MAMLGLQLAPEAVTANEGFPIQPDRSGQVSPETAPASEDCIIFIANDMKHAAGGDAYFEGQ